jgi:hypothetical protein
MKKDHLKQNISKHLKVKPSEDFTQHVMQDVFKVADEAYLKSHLKAPLLQKAPVNFTDKVMAGISLENESVYQPVISKTVWYILGLIFVVVLTIGLNNSAMSTTQTKYVTEALSMFNTMLLKTVGSLLNQKFIISLMFGVVSLLMLEIVLKSKQSLFKK